MIVTGQSGRLCRPGIMSTTSGQQLKGLRSKPDVLFCPPSTVRAEKVRVADTARPLLGPVLTEAASMEFGGCLLGIREGGGVGVWGWWIENWKLLIRTIWRTKSSGDILSETYQTFFKWIAELSKGEEETQNQSTKHMS